MISLLLQIGYAVLLLFYLRGWKRGAVRSAGLKVPVRIPFVSVLVPVRNEAQNLETIIRSLRLQDYPVERTEWIFINDHSEDNTLTYLREVKDSRLKIIDLPEKEGFGKKAALTAGVRTAGGEWVLTSDADCELPPGWISTMIKSASVPGVNMCCGLVKVDPQYKVLDVFQAMETAILQVCGAGSLEANHPLLNTGASLAFRKSTWMETSGYRKQENIASGDDTFLMLSFHAAFPGTILPLIHPNALARTKPMAGILQIMCQRLRWNGKVKHYPLGYVHLVGLIVTAAAFAFIWEGVRMFTQHPDFLRMGIVFMIRLIPEILLLQQWKKITTQHFPLYQIIIMSVCYPLFTLFSFILRPFVSNSWKGRPL